MAEMYSTEWFAQVVELGNGLAADATTDRIDEDDSNQWVVFETPDALSQALRKD